MASKAISKKDRRNSGRVIVEEIDGYSVYWDNWNDWRDGIRFPFDNTKLRDTKSIYCEECREKGKRFNKKLKRLLERRKMMKHKNNIPMV